MSGGVRGRGWRFGIETHSTSDDSAEAGRTMGSSLQKRRFSLRIKLRKKIGECLIQAGLITEEDLGVALTEHKRTGERVGVVLIRMNLATEKQIAKALAFQLGFPYMNLAENPPDSTAVILIPKDVALKRVCIAVRLEKNLLTVAMSDPLLFSVVQDLEFQTGYRIKQVVATRGDISEAIQTGYPDKALVRTTPESRSEMALRERDAVRRAPTGELPAP